MLPAPGEQMGTTQQNGYSICWGQRDGLGSTDLAFIPQYIYDAAEQAGVELSFAPLYDRFFRLHWLPSGTTSDLPAELVVPNNNDPMQLMREIVRCFSSITDPQQMQVIAEELFAVFGQLRGIPIEEAWQQYTARRLAAARRSGPVRHPAGGLVTTVTPAEETSLGRYIIINHVRRRDPAERSRGRRDAGVISPGIAAGLGADLSAGTVGSADNDEVTGIVAVNDGSLVKTFGADRDHRLASWR